MILTLTAASAAEAPTLSETDRLRVVVAVQAVEIAQLHLTAAQRELADARQRVDALLASLKREGYLLDLSTLTYRPIDAQEPMP